MSGFPASVYGEPKESNDIAEVPEISEMVNATRLWVGWACWRCNRFVGGGLAGSSDFVRRKKKYLRVGYDITIS